jgi:hypothetical protein
MLYTFCGGQATSYSISVASMFIVSCFKIHSRTRTLMFFMYELSTSTRPATSQ